MFGAGFSSGCIGSERDPIKHMRMKRMLLPAFSAKALSSQEGVIQSCVDLFITKIGPPKLDQRTAAIDGKRARKGGTDTDQTGLNLTAWYEMLAFDILGAMAFGESFHCLERGQPHFWQQMIASHLFWITVADSLRRYPFIKWLGAHVLPSLTAGVRAKHTGFSRAKIKRSLQMFSTIRNATHCST